MAHIVIDARIINSSTGRYIERLLHYLEKIDSENQYTVLIPTKDLAFWTPTNPNFSVKTADFAQYSLAEQIGFKTFLDSLNADLVHFCMPQQPVFYRGKHVTTIHDLTLLKTYNSDKNWLIYHAKQFIGKFVFRQVCKSSLRILAPTEHTKMEIIERFGTPSEKIVVAKLAAEHTIEKTRRYPHPFKHFLLYVGQQPDYKNIRRLGAAHQKLLEKYPDLGLILVGRKAGDTLANETYFLENGYKNIHFTDFIEDDQRDWLLRNAAVYVFPSLFEGFGLPGLEAMAAGTAVASSNASCLPEVYGDAAAYFDPKNIDQMADTISKIIDDPALQRDLIKKGHKKLAEYSWERTAEQTHAAYIDALNA